MKRATCMLLSVFVGTIGLVSCTKEYLHEPDLRAEVISPVKDTLTITLNTDDPKGEGGDIDYEVDQPTDDTGEGGGGGGNTPGVHGNSEKGMYVHPFSPLIIKAHYERRPDGKYNVTVSAAKDPEVSIVIKNIKIYDRYISYFPNGFRVDLDGEYTSYFVPFPEKPRPEYFQTSFDVRL